MGGIVGEVLEYVLGSREYGWVLGRGGQRNLLGEGGKRGQYIYKSNGMTSLGVGWG